MFLSLLAASVDGFVCGFMIGGMGIEFRFNDFIKSFGIIFGCCVAASFTGNILAQTHLQIYINILGVIVMLALAWSALRGEIENKSNTASIGWMALSVAMDASVVCLYLAMCGYDIWLVSFLSALMHSVLMGTAAVISNRVIKEQWLIYTRYISGMIFLCMALYKMITIKQG